MHNNGLGKAEIRLFFPISMLGYYLSKIDRVEWASYRYKKELKCVKLYLTDKSQVIQFTGEAAIQDKVTITNANRWTMQFLCSEEFPVILEVFYNFRKTDDISTSRIRNHFFFIFNMLFLIMI